MTIFDDFYSQVVLDLIPIFTLPEQKEILLYNVLLTSRHFDSYKNSFFVNHAKKSDERFVVVHLTSILNKLVDDSSTIISKNVIDGIIQGCLMSPYITLLQLLKQACRQNGYEKVLSKVKHEVCL